MTVSDRFELASPARIVFGAGTVAELGGIARAFGSRALVVTGRSTERGSGAAVAALGREGLHTTALSVSEEPTVALVRTAAQAARDARCDLVIGFGGGSALDAAKAVAALLANDGDVLDYLEVIGRAQPLAHAGVPFIAVPTTAGTGSEVTKNAVLASPKERVKASLRSPHMLARVALVDPDLLASLPPAVIASGGLDALSQLIEPFLSARANPVTDALAREGMQRSARSLLRAYEQGLAGPEEHRRRARADLAIASLMGGLCLANAGLGAVHGFAAPAGGMWPVPHGAACAALLPHAMRANLNALESRAPHHPALARFSEVAALLTGRAGASASDGIAWLDHLCAALAVPGLSRYGMTPPDIPDLVSKAKVASSMKGNPLPLTDDELTEIARRAL
jgi:alcohol dehydrogenase class IV